ncbi:MAG: SpoIIE family protein phosphatase [Verrucomicrobiota bacterium]
MDAKPIKVLLVEDNPEDVFLLQRILSRGRGAQFEIESEESLKKALARLERGDIDVVLLDLSLTDSQGLETFYAIQSQVPQIPIIVLSGLDDETVALKAVHAGAQDYLVKGRVDSQLITRSMIYAIERSQAKAALFQAEEKYRSIFVNAVEGIFQTSPEGGYLNVNPALTRIYGYSSAEELMSSLTDIGKSLYLNPNRREEFIRQMRENGVVTDFESQIYRKDGSVIWISEHARAVRDPQGKLCYYEGLVEDITKRKMTEETLRFSEMRFRSVWENASDGMRLTDSSGVILAVNPSFCRIVGMSAEELEGKPFTVIYSGTNELPEMMGKYKARFAERTIDMQLERHVTFRSGKVVDLELSNSFVDLEHRDCLLLSVLHDITVRRQAEDRERQANLELARSQAELRKKNEMMEDDLRMAHEIQQAILPQQYPSFPAGVPVEESLIRFCHRYHPTGQVGGDFFSVLPLSDSKAGLFICDVMGHGVRSALVTAMVRAMVEELKSVAADPGQLLTRINRDLRAILKQTGTPLFTTAFYLIADLESRQFFYANAGHPKPFLLHRQSNVVELMKNSDGRARPALGLFHESVYPTSQMPMLPGDLVMLYTDGLYEIEGKEGEQYSPQLLFSAVEKHAKKSCADLFDALLAEVQGFSSSKEFADDVCLVALELAHDLPPAKSAAN